MPEDNSIENLEVQGSLQGIAGEVSGGIINQSFVYYQSEDRIHDRPLIKTSPYLGLITFKVEDKDKFFGREKWITQLSDRLLKQDNVLLLLGASGSGKSSLIRAGLIPNLQDNWGRFDNLTFNPDINPFESLYNCLAPQFGQSKAEVVKTTQEDILVNVVKSLKQNNQWLIFIDQFEELFTRTSKLERDKFVDSLVQLINQKDSSVKIVLTMRADFLDKFNDYSDLGDIHNKYSLLLTKMSEIELRLAIAEPAARNGVTFEKGLVDQITRDFGEQDGSLPLLEYTLDLLWEEDKPIDRVLNNSSYEKIGGVKGALNRQADQIYQNLSPKEQELTKEIFLDLIGITEKEPVSRRSDKSKFLNNEVEASVLEKLIGKRLLFSSGDEKEIPTIEIAHEALISNWSLLNQWVKDNQEVIRKKQKIADEAQEWVQNNRAEEDLLSGRKLRDAEDLLERFQDGSLAQEFINKSIDKQRRIERERKLRLLLAKVAIAVMAPALLATSIWNWRSFQNAEMVRLAKSSDLLSDSYKGADTLVESLKAATILKNLDAFKLPFIIDPNTRTQVVAALRRAVYSLKEMNSLEGHGKRIDNVSFSLDGKTLASVDVDGTIKLWNTDGTLLQTIHGHTRNVYGISFSPDGKMFAAASRDGTIKLWNQNGTLLKTLLGHSNQVYRAIFSPDGKTLVSASADSSIKFWSLDGKLLRTIQADQLSIFDISFNPNGQILASAGSDGTVKLWDSANGNLIKAFHAQQCNQERCSIWAVSFTPDGKFLATASDNATIRLGKADGTFVSYIDQPGNEDGGHIDKILGLSFNPNTPRGKYILASASTDRSVRVWDLPQSYFNLPLKAPGLKPNILQLSGHIDSVLAVKFTLDGQVLASSSSDQTVKLWNIERKLEERLHRNEKVKSVSFSLDGKTIASGSYLYNDKQGNIRFWNWKEKSERWEPNLVKAHTNLIWQVSFSPDGQTLASVSKDGTLKLWSRNGELIASSENIGIDFFSVSFNRDGKTLASGDANNNVILWQYDGNSLIQKKILPRHTGDVRTVSFSPDGQVLASGDLKNVIKLWRRDGNSWKFYKDLKGHSSKIQGVTFSPDNQLIASSSVDRTIKLWNRNGDLLNTLYGHINVVTQVAFSPDSQTIASVGADRRVILWGRNGTLIHTIKEHKDEVYGVQFSRDGKTLATASDDGRVILWNLNLEDLLEQSCTLARNYLRTNPSITPEVRNFCKVPEIDAKLLLEQGRDLARVGNTQEAINKFKEAKKQGQKLDNPKNEANRLSDASKLLAKGLEKSQQGKLTEAANDFKTAIALDPAFANAKFDPEQEAKRIYALTLLNDDKKYANKAIADGNVGQAINYYKQAKELYPEIEISARTLDSLCRAGSTQRQYANDIMQFCNQAVSLDAKRSDPQNQNGKIRDHRGLARLFLQKNTQGAIQDFQAFINWTKTEQALSSYNREKPQDWQKKLAEWRKQRQDCIAALKPKIISSRPNKTFPKAQIPDSCKPIKFKLT